MLCVYIRTYDNIFGVKARVSITDINDKSTQYKCVRIYIILFEKTFVAFGSQHWRIWIACDD